MFCVHTHACVLAHSVVSGSANPGTVAHHAPLSVAFPRQECWSGLPCSSPGDGPDPGIKPASPALAGGFFTSEPAGKPGSHSPRGKYLKVEFPSHRAGVWFNSEKVPDHFPKWLLCWLLFKIYESNWGFGLCRDSA